MKANILKIFWGIILVSLVGLTLACMMGYVTFDLSHRSDEYYSSSLA